MAHPATSTAASTTAPAKASGTSAAASTSGGEAASAQSGIVKVNRFMSYDATAKTVKLEVIAAFNSVQGGFNFNGGSNGSQTITVPAGWTVAMHVKNVDAIPHSAIIIADQKPLPNAPDSPAISRAYTSHVNDGLQAQTGSDDLNFRASKPGNYLIYCGVPGHGPSGMYIRFVVSESATTPSYSM
ncbi:MAG TPA: sulfocyanin-like copper-binding protein [Gemmatimonadaceae bacterium]|nr:sulfocyanin-like copper-binding protein [Gemmatimonadaceae bacterium]